MVQWLLQNARSAGNSENILPAHHVGTCFVGNAFCNGCKLNTSAHFAEKVCNLQELCHCWIMNDLCQTQKLFIRETCLVFYNKPMLFFLCFWLPLYHFHGVGFARSLIESEQRKRGRESLVCKWNSCKRKHLRFTCFKFGYQLYKGAPLSALNTIFFR